MRRTFEQRIAAWLFFALLSVLVCCLIGCAEDEDDDDDQNPADDDDDQGDSGYYQVDINVDYRDTGRLVFNLDDDTGEIEHAMLLVDKGSDVIVGQYEHYGSGQRYVYPESGYALYTFKFQGLSTYGGPCGQGSVSLSMNLSGKPPNGFYSGGIACYCGDGVYGGRPVRFVRTSGLIEPIE